MFRMPQELKDKWVAALRSGEYEQCKNTLHNGTGYCCLGVLQMVADGKVEAGDAPDSMALPIGIPTYRWTISKGIGDWISGTWVVRDGQGESNTLQWINDSGASFAEIADIIEDQVVGT